MTHSLTLGSLLLTDSLPNEDHGYKFNVLADGATFGVAQGVQEIVRSLLADGDLVRITRYGNREVTFQVEITGPTLTALAEGEAALRREVGHGNLLTWQPPDTMSVATVFEVVTSEMAQNFDDLDELRRSRVFTVTLACSPGARSAGLTTVTALATPPVTPVTTTITNADTTTGFSANAETPGGSVAVTVTDEGSYAQATISSLFPSLGMTYTLVSPVAMATTPYLAIEASFVVSRSSSSTATARPSFTMTLDGVTSIVSPVLTRATTSGTVIYVFKAVGTLSKFSVFMSYPNTLGVTGLTLNVHDAYRTNTLPQVSKRQTTATIEVGGTERTPGSIRVATGSTPMGFTLVHTSPTSLEGYAPPLRRWRTAGNTVTADANLFSGGREVVNLTPFEVQVPLSSLPDGDYVLAAVMRSTVAGTFPITWTANSLIPGYGYLGPTVSGIAQARFTDPGFWTLVPLDVVTLPPVRATNALAVVQLTLNRAPVSTEVIDIDEWWAFRIGTDCALTVVNNPVSRLWLDSPDASRPVPQVWVGDFNNRADARHPGDRLIAQGAHVLGPEGTSIFVAANGADSPDVTASFYRRYHSNAAT